MRTIDLLVKNARIITPGSGAITPPDTIMAVDKGVVLEVAPGSRRQEYLPKEELDAAGKYVFPGLINTHNHLFQVLTKGLGKEKLLWEWLNSTIMKLTPHIDEEALYYAALAGCMANIRSGSTTMLDFQYLHSHPGHFEAVCQAFEDSGMRGYIGRMQYFDEYNGLTKVKPETPEEYFRNMSGIVAGMKDRSMVDAAIIFPIIIGLLENPVNHPGYPQEVREWAEELGIPYTAHLVETKDDDDYSEKYLGMSTVKYLDKEKFFGPRCVLAHCVKMADDDFRIFRENRVKVSYNPVSNMTLASGVAPIGRFLREGIDVSLATDGPGSNDSQDMLEAMKMASLLQKVANLDSRTMTAGQTLEMATLGGARALNREDLGVLQAGKRADFFLYNPSALRSAPVADPIASLVYTSGESSIHTVVINGKVVLNEGAFPHLNEGQVVEKLENNARRVREAAGYEV